MPQQESSHDAARKRLDARLEAFEADRVAKPTGLANAFTSSGSRFLGEVVGGVLGGAGFGWLLDRFAGTGPWGLIGGLLIGTGLSIFVAVRSAAKMQKQAMEEAGPLPSVPFDDEND